MKVILRRNIYCHSESTGLISKIVFKECNWEVVPVIGAIVDDCAWHRNDITKIQSISIEAEEGNEYYVELNPLKTDSSLSVDKYVEIAKLHDWNLDS